MSIWLILSILGFAVAMGVVLWTAKASRTVWLICGAGLLAAILGYLAIGSPNSPDQPMAQRIEELAERDVADLTPAETMARLEQLAAQNPDDPQPHYFIGEQLKRQGRDDDAVRAYQSALRRNPTFTPALEGLGDALVRRSGGEVGADAQGVYRAVLGQDPSNLRVAFLVGLGDWQAGLHDEALVMWRQKLSTLSEDDPRRAMFEAWVEAAMEAEPAE